MASFINKLMRKLLNVNNVTFREPAFRMDRKGQWHLTVQAMLGRRISSICPKCGRKCPGYDSRNGVRRWRGLDLGGIIVEIECSSVRIECPEHGVVSASVPWAYDGSSFTKDFDRTVAWLATAISKSAVCEFMRIDWKTVGRCVSRALHDIEPDLSARLDGLVNIGIDETSYRKGHKYITIIVNHDTNTVVWIHDGHGKSVLEMFYRGLTEEQKSSIRVVTGDGARWITECVNEYTPDCVRCMDSFHVVEWAMAALDSVRIDEWNAARKELSELRKSIEPKRGRPRSDDETSAIIKEARDRAESIKKSSFAVGKAPENLTESQRIRLEKIRHDNKRYYRAYDMKEKLRMILKSHDAHEARILLDKWRWRASHSRIEAFKELSRKIKRNQEFILNTIRFGLSNARIEATNNKIKLIIRKAYGFRNIDSMMDMIYLVCSNIKIQLPNRPIPLRIVA